MGPVANGQIFPEIEAAAADVEAAFAEARRTGRRVILSFGGDWCPDCQALHVYFGQSPNAELLAEHYILVNVNVGMKDANLDVAQRYGVAVTSVPVLAVVDGEGKVVHAQGKEFSNMREMESSVVTEFLNRWKP